MSLRTTRRTSGRTRRRIGLAVALAGVLVLTACGGSSNGSSSANGKTLQVWLGGVLEVATPGSAFRSWVNNDIARFEAAHPGTKVNVTILPVDNDAQAAKLQAAFTSHAVPDVMLLYAGAYTTVYQQALLPLNKLVDSTPGLYKTLSGWNLSCENLNCENGSAKILGIPVDLTGFFMFYNKKLFAEAGLSGPPTSWSGLVADCSKLKAKGILPMSYGDQEGYTTVNFLDENLASFITQAQMNAILAGHLKLTDPAVVSALQSVEQLRTGGCAQPDASTVPQATAVSAFAGGKSAMVEMETAELPAFEAGIGAGNVGVSIIPGTGPLGTHVAGNETDDWVIPADAAHTSLAWDFIKVAMSTPEAAQWTKIIAQPTTNLAAGGTGEVSDPRLQFMVTNLHTGVNLDLLDSVLPNGVALYLYKELNLFFSGQISAYGALNATQSQLNASLAQSQGG
jgi:ABC-type glycerol-3-phosphate transport system substrate-binding protein